MKLNTFSEKPTEYPSNKEKAFLDSLDVKLKERSCRLCGYNWLPMRLSAFHCAKCRQTIGLSDQANQILQRFYEKEEPKMPLSEKEKALIKDLSKDLDDLVSEKLKEHVPEYVNKTFGMLAGKLLNLGVDKFFPYFEEKLDTWNPENLDFSKREEPFRIAGCDAEEAEMIAGLFGVDIPAKPVPPPSPKRTPRPQKVEAPPVVETETYQPTVEEENLIISTLKKIAKEDLEYYIESKEVGINSLLFLALPHLRKLSKEHRQAIQDIDLEFVRGLIEQVRPDLYEIIERKDKNGKKEGIIWLRIFLKKAKELCKDEPINNEET